jgi:dUTP pyrophosphatase
MNTIQLKKLNDLATIPSKGSGHSAGYDLSSIEEYVLMPMERKLFKTGISIVIPNGMYGRIAPRSGLAFKDGIDTMAGVIDEDYRGEIGVLLINLGTIKKQIKIGDKIAQLIIEFYIQAIFEEVAELNETDRGEGGFGSTDIKPVTKNHTDSIVTIKHNSPLLDKYKESAIAIPTPPESYERLIKEREKTIT